MIFSSHLIMRFTLGMVSAKILDIVNLLLVRDVPVDCLEMMPSVVHNNLSFIF